MEKVPYMLRVHIQTRLEKVHYTIRVQSPLVSLYLRVECSKCYYDSLFSCSVIALSNPQFKVGDTITMKLMMREKVCFPVCSLH
jgi:hypothetical protein